jgi:hypothetical protein
MESWEIARNCRGLPLVDANGDGIIDDNDRMPLFWSGTPLIHYGFNLEASWKNFDIYALLQGAGMYTVQFSEVYAEVLWSKGANTPAYFMTDGAKKTLQSNSKWVPEMACYPFNTGYWSYV